jgi:hypothetical protein
MFKPLFEKAHSKTQQRLMGMVYCYLKKSTKKRKEYLEELPASLAAKIKDIADGHKRKTGDKREKTKGMSKSDVEDFARTKHEGLPEKVEEHLITKFNKFVNESKNINEIDQILDKISKEGINSLSSREKVLLNNFDKDISDSDLEYYMDEDDFNSLNNHIDEMLEKKWSSLDIELMSAFISSNELNESIADKEWNELTEDEKELFELFVYENDLDNNPTSVDEYELLWDGLSDDKTDEFIDFYELNQHCSSMLWDELSDDIKSKFKIYAEKTKLIK